MSNIVKDIYKIDVDLLVEKAEQSEYLEKCFQFYSDVENKDIGKLSDKQVEWLNKIEKEF